MLILLFLCGVRALRQYNRDNGINLQIEAGDATRINRVQIVARIDRDGSIMRHQPTRSSSFEIGRIGREIQVFVRNVSVANSGTCFILRKLYIQPDW